MSLFSWNTIFLESGLSQISFSKIISEKSDPCPTAATVKGRGSQHSMTRHAVAVVFTVLIYTLLGLVSEMPGPAAPSRSACPRLQCQHCFRGFKTHANFCTHQAAISFIVYDLDEEELLLASTQDVDFKKLLKHYQEKLII